MPGAHHPGEAPSIRRVSDVRVRATISSEDNVGRTAKSYNVFSMCGCEPTLMFVSVQGWDSCVHSVV